MFFRAAHSPLPSFSSSLLSSFSFPSLFFRLSLDENIPLLCPRGSARGWPSSNALDSHWGLICRREWRSISLLSSQMSSFCRRCSPMLGNWSIGVFADDLLLNLVSPYPIEDEWIPLLCPHLLHTTPIFSSVHPFSLFFITTAVIFAFIWNSCAEVSRKIISGFLVAHRAGSVSWKWC